MRQQALPACVVPGPPELGRFAKPLPASVLDLDPGRDRAPGNEADVNLGGTTPVEPEVPQVRQPARGLPYDHLAPVVLGAVGRPLIDAAADIGLQNDKLRAPGDSMIRRPPGADSGRPDSERVLR